MTSRSRPVKYCDAELKKLAVSVGIERMPAHIAEQLNAASAAYYYSSLSDQPRKGEMELFGRSWASRSAQLSAIRGIATQLITGRSTLKLQAGFGLLIHNLKSLDAITSQYLSAPLTIDGYAALFNSLKSEESRVAFAGLRSASAAALKRIPRRPGRPRDSRHDFVLQLASIYQCLTNRKIGYSREGPFARFVKAALYPIRSQDLIGIDDVVRRACRAFAKS